MMHPLSGCIRLSHLLSILPRSIERHDTPPYLHTLALLESLEHLKLDACLWNAKLESRRRITVVAGVRMGQEILDWNGHDPRQYPHLYPILQGGTFSQAGSEDLIPGKRALAFKSLPMVLEIVNEAVDYLWLSHATHLPDGEGTPRRL